METYYAMFLTFAYSPSLLVAHIASPPCFRSSCDPVLCPLCHFKAGAFDYFDQQHSQAFPVQYKNATLLQLLFTGCSLCYGAAVKIHITANKTTNYMGTVI